MHVTEDDLILYYYGEPSARLRQVERHLQICEACRTSFEGLVDTLGLVSVQTTPDRGDQYGLEVWQRIRHQLPDQDPPWWLMPQWLGNRLLACGALIALIVGAFLVGRLSQPRSVTDPPIAQALDASRATTSEDDSRDRILLSALADHLEKSDRILTDILNADSPDISVEQRWAEDLLTASRLYRQDAIEVGEPLVADVLDELERSLLEVVHSPSHISAGALEDLRTRIDAATVLFKVRVLGDALRRRESPPTPTSTPISRS